MKNQPITKDFLHLGMFLPQLLKIAASAASSPSKEIGGWLWGFVTRTGQVIVLYASLASKGSLRTHSNFEETVAHLNSCNECIFELYRLGIIGRWHSHHFIDLRNPSSGDIKTGNSCARKNGINPFVEIIITLQGSKDNPTAHIHPYAYKDGETVGMVIDSIEGDSPISAELENTVVCENIIGPDSPIARDRVFWPELPKPVAAPPDALIDEINAISEVIREKLDVTYDGELANIRLTLSADCSTHLTYGYDTEEFTLISGSLKDGQTEVSLTDSIGELPYMSVSNLILFMLQFWFSSKEATNPVTITN